MPVPRVSAARLAATLTIVAALVAGCSDDSPEPSATNDALPTNDAQAATGDTIKGDSYTFAAPKGWEQRDKEDAGVATIDVAVVDPDDDDGFVDNINVSEQPQLAQFTDVEALAGSAEQGLGLSNAKDIKIVDPIALDGNEAAVITATLTRGESEYDVIQYYVPHGDTGYIVNFSFNEDRPVAEQQAVAQSVAAGWKWTS